MCFKQSPKLHFFQIILLILEILVNKIAIINIIKILFINISIVYVISTFIIPHSSEIIYIQADR